MTSTKLVLGAVGVASIAIGGCASGSGLTTGSLFGGGDTTKVAAAAAVPAAPTSDPTSRAFSVGSLSARAMKCGYNFDPVKLKSSFLAAETASIAPADLGRVEKIYDTAFGGVTKAIATEPNYCTPVKTADIKQNLARHLAGDFTPAVVKQAPVADDGWFGNWSGSGSDGGPAYGSDAWWDSQRDKIGG
jgi:hypothetical protein